MADIATRPAGLRLRPSEHRTLLLIGDLIASVLALAGAVYSWLGYSWYSLISSGVKPEQALKFFPNLKIPFWFYLMPIIWLMLLIELYDPHNASSRRRTLRGVAIAAFVGIVAYSLVFITNREPTSLPRIGVGSFLLLASLLTLVWRFIYIRLYKTTGMTRRVLVIGAGKAGKTLAQVYKRLNTPPFRLIGFVDDDQNKIGKVIEGFPVMGSSGDLLRIIESARISDVVVAITGEMRGGMFQAILDIQESGIEVTRMPTVYEEMIGRVPIHHLESDWIIRSFVDQARANGFYELGKRFLDILGGLLFGAFFIVVFPFIALATLIDTGRPILYTQKRQGKSGREFRIYKFRTMRQDAEADGLARLAVENDPRITRVGGFLRKTRLDELPQFINVLRGDMSLVGPRAERRELVESFQKKIPFYRARLLVKPGLTGWAQINYGYAATVEDTVAKLEYDLYYIKHRTLSMDLSILLRTVGTVLRSRGR